MTKQIRLGILGENLAAEYLRKKGYGMVERNCRKKWGELDVVAISPDKKLVFVEVKTVSGIDPKITGEDQMTASKIKKFKRAAKIYADGCGQLLAGERGWQLDLITVELSKNTARVRHYQNI
ncbi:MAG: YraN family protein [Candidatus Colwellbacteria bacterium]|nr:YraN family protein [Candidatus Colwellbacteria bacterium]